jgi:hypothetical protein
LVTEVRNQSPPHHRTWQARVFSSREQGWLLDRSTTIRWRDLFNPRADRARQLHSGVAIGSAGSADTKRYVRDPDPSATRISFRALEEAGIS